MIGEPGQLNCSKYREYSFEDISDVTECRKAATMIGPGINFGKEETSGSTPKRCYLEENLKLVNWNNHTVGGNLCDTCRVLCKIEGMNIHNRKSISITFYLPKISNKVINLDQNEYFFRKY